MFEDCQQKGGVRETLLPFAIIALCTYVVRFWRHSPHGVHARLGTGCVFCQGTPVSHPAFSLHDHVRDRYTITYPCMLFYILYQNRMKIMEDQLLRAEGRGASRLENPNCYQIRKMYHKYVSVALSVTAPVLGRLCGCECYIVVMMTSPCAMCSGRMYYHFRPDYWFWIVVILGRKLLIAVTALMFNKNPAFQMAIALLVLFICYALQVWHGDAAGALVA